MITMTPAVLNDILAGINLGQFTFTNAMERHGEIWADVTVAGIDHPIGTGWMSPTPADGMSLSDFAAAVDTVISEAVVTALVYAYLYDLDNDCLTELGREAFPDIEGDVLAPLYARLNSLAGLS